MVFQPARRRFRERLPHPGVVVAVAATLATVGTGALLSTDAFAAAAPPPLEMVASVDHQTFTRYEGEGFYPYGLGLFVRAGNSPLEIRTTRDPSYAKPVTASIWTGGTRSIKLRDVPAGLVTDVNTLTKFFTMTVRTKAGRTVLTKDLNFCPSSYEAARATPTAPARSPYPTSCGYHPFALGGVLGIEKGWSVPALSDWFYGDEDESTDLPDGDYSASLSIKPAYRSLFAVPAKSATASLAFTLVTEEDPYEGDGGSGAGLARAATASSHHHETLSAAAVSKFSPQEQRRLEVLERSWGQAVTPGSAAGARALAAKTAAAKTAAAKTAAAKPKPAGPRPDLRALPANGIVLTDGDTGEEPAPTPTGKTYLAFGATIWNGGNSPLVVDGFRRKGTGLMDAYQYFFDTKGNQVGSAPAGTLQWDPRPGHTHWHFTAFGTYRLLDATKTKAIRSDKEAFCLAATDPVDLTRPGVNYKPGSTDLSTACGGEAALSLREQLDAGWGDTYQQYLPGQSFDVTTVPAGTYYIEVRANPEGKLAESDTSNNVSLRKIVLGGKPGGTRTVKVPPVGLIDAP